MYRWATRTKKIYSLISWHSVHLRTKFQCSFRIRDADLHSCCPISQCAVCGCVFQFQFLIFTSSITYRAISFCMKWYMRICLDAASDIYPFLMQIWMWRIFGLVGSWAMTHNRWILFFIRLFFRFTIGFHLCHCHFVKLRVWIGVLLLDSLYLESLTLIDEFITVIMLICNL